LIDTCGNKDEQDNYMCNGLVDGQPVSTGDGECNISFMYGPSPVSYFMLFFKQLSCHIVIYVPNNKMISPLLLEAFGTKVTEMILTAGKTLLVLR
jgi:hypothetical protein